MFQFPYQQKEDKSVAYKVLLRLVSTNETLLLLLLNSADSFLFPGLC